MSFKHCLILICFNFHNSTVWLPQASKFPALLKASELTSPLHSNSLLLEKVSVRIIFESFDPLDNIVSLLLKSSN